MLIRQCVDSPFSGPVLRSKVGAMKQVPYFTPYFSPLYCKAYHPLPHGTSGLSRFRFVPSVPTPFLCGVKYPLPHGTSRLSRFRFGQSVPTPSLSGLPTAKSKCCCSIWKRKGPGTKSISVIAKGSWYKINFGGWTALQR